MWGDREHVRTNRDSNQTTFQHSTYSEGSSTRVARGKEMTLTYGSRSQRGRFLDDNKQSKVQGTNTVDIDSTKFGEETLAWAASVGTGYCRRSTECGSRWCARTVKKRPSKCFPLRVEPGRGRGAGQVRNQTSEPPTDGGGTDTRLRMGQATNEMRGKGEETNRRADR